MKQETNCVFCKIVSREIPAEIVYEDENFLVFVDIEPQSPGHCQVIPRNHYRWVWDTPNVGEYFEVVKKIALAQKKAFNTDFVLSKVAGSEVPHAHIWVFPTNQVIGNKKDFKGNASKIKESL